MSHPSHIKNILPHILGLLILICGAFYTPSVNALSVAPCPDSSTVVRYDYLGACGLTRTSVFTLDTAADVSRIRIWYNTNIGSAALNVKITSSNGFQWSGFSTKGGCDPYQKNWCEGFVYLNQRLEVGTYTVDIGSVSMCANPSGLTTLLVYGCDAILFPPYDFRYTLTGDLLTLNWDGSLGANGYVLLWGLNSGNYTDGLEVDNITQIGPFNVSNFPKIKLYAAVAAYDNTGYSLLSNEIVIDFGGIAVLAAPQQLRANLTGTLLTLNWNQVPGSSGYLLHIGNQSGLYFGKVDLGNSLQLGPFDTSGLPKGDYYLTVTAYGANKESAYSNEIKVTLKSTGTGNTGDTTRYIDSVMTFSHDLLNGGVTEQLEPILSALLSKPTGTCPKVALNADLSNSKDIETLLQNLPKPTIANIDYGSGCTGEKGNQFSGSAEVKLDNLAIDSTSKTLAASLTIVSNNLVKDGKIIGDGTVAGTINANLQNSTGNAHFDLTNFLVSTGKRLTGSVDLVIVDNKTFDIALNFDISTNIHTQLTMRAIKLSDDSYSISTKNPGIVNDMNVSLNSIVFDTKVCATYPIAGHAVFTGNGQTQTATFDNRCNGTYTLN